MRLLPGIALAVAAACLASVCLLAPGYYAYIVGTLATTTLVGIGLNVLLGLTGEVSLGQAGFVALGAYGVAILTTKLGLGVWLALPLSIVLVAAISAVLSIPALRLTGPYLAMVTIAFGFIVEAVSVEWQGLTGGSSGIGGIPAPFGTGGTALIASGICAAALAAFHHGARSPLGLAMQAVAAAPAAARSIGISPVPVRTTAFVIAAMIAGLAGGLQAMLTGFIAPTSFPFSQSILFLLAVILGGTGRTLGPLVGAIVVVLLPEVLSSFADYRLLVFGAGLLLVLLVAPEGLAGAMSRPFRAVAPGRQAIGADRALAYLGESRGGLMADGLRVAFGGVVAVGGVDLEAPPGRVTSVIGPNGAGKTTLLNCISGFQRPDAGTVRVEGCDVSRLASHALARAGLARTFQTAQPFGTLSVIDNVRLGLLRGRWRGAIPTELARSLLDLVGHVGPEDQPSAALAHVDRRLVEIARALATRPSVLLLDEPAAGLDDADKGKLKMLLRRLADAGLAIVLVEHDMGLVMGVSDAIVVLDAGHRIAFGTPAAVRADPAVKAAYLGAAAPTRAAEKTVKHGPRLLAAERLDAGYGSLAVLRSVGLHVGRGETIAVLGPNGAGKSTLMKALSGLIRPVSGSIGLGSTDLARLPAHKVAQAGLILVPEGRQVFPGLSVAQNLRLGATRRRDFGADEIEGMLRRFPRLRARLETAAGLLSGGEQQMLAVARGLLARPDILLLDEPSIGLAPGVAAELFEQFAALEREGMTLLIADQMADHVLAIADRGYVLGGGRIVAEGPASSLRGAGLEDAYLGVGETR